MLSGYIEATSIVQYSAPQILAYRPQTNGVVIGQNLKKSTKNYKDWHLQLPYALWGYRKSTRSSTGATSYSLVYRMKAVLPIEMGIPSLRTVLESEILK